MDKQIHPNFIKSSNLIFGSVGLGLINFFFTSNILTSTKNIILATITLLIITGLGFLVRQGKNWIKYLLLVLTIVGLIGIPFILKNTEQEPVVGIINIAQTILQVFAMYLLFRIPNLSEDNLINNNSTDKTL